MRVHQTYIHILLSIFKLKLYLLELLKRKTDLLATVHEFRPVLCLDFLTLGP